METERKCIRCEVVWPISMYRLSDDRENRRRECKVCHRNKMAEWRRNNREKYLEARHRWYAKDAGRKRMCAERRKSDHRSRQKTKYIVLEHYGAKCNCCGEAEIHFLTVDHINNDGAAHRRTMNHANQWLWLVRNNFPPGFQILCMNCNFGKRMAGGVCPHTLTVNA